ncbi:dnaJ homolog subfamily C member 9 [Polypterus senegalus]|uniref:dnaJ homolog subfamily C member 9 n=1 Tax=Polypterus senegalus TaxID=55291 RepID=UPI001962BC1E|nr:dnaJ homolog subfamily C member 9 [Polypterus senegalus]XP_039625007.1 dnaJ homolog subfamily C member 9 [Polypterus senegalus]
MGFLESCKDLFGTSDLYEVLGVNKQASDAEIRKAYYKVSLRVHPDRALNDEQATVKFQALGKIYAVLSDKDQRAIYDEQGIVDEESDTLCQDRNWEDYWRLLFPKITTKDILSFEKNYKGSEEEEADIKAIYIRYEGDLDHIMNSVLCTTYEDEPRIRDIIQAGIDSGELPTFKAFTNESVKKKEARKRKALKEKKEAEKMKKEMDEENSLAMLIKKKQESRSREMDSFLSQLEAKYCKKENNASNKKGKKNK